ncbi:MAG: hypothetical protein ACUVRK_03220 [Spirochaetota bacterium]
MDDIKRLTELVVHRLGQPFIVDDDIKYFAQSALGIDADEIGEHCNDDNGMVELILTPNVEFRKSIELLIPASGISVSDNNAITTEAMKNIAYITIMINNSNLYRIDKNFIQIFIKKLLLHKKNIDIKNHYDLSFYYSAYCTARVAIRLFAQEHNFAVIEQVVKAMIPKYDEIMLFDAIHLFTQIISDKHNIYEMCSLHKQRLQKQLWDMYEFKKLLNNYSMEFLMSMRRTAPMVDVGATVYQIKLIDAMCVSLYGFPARGFAYDIEMELNSDTIKNLIDM